MENYEEYEQQDKGFEIKCLDCGSTNCSYKCDYDYDYEENLVINGYYLVCHDCGQSQL